MRPLFKILTSLDDQNFANFAWIFPGLKIGNIMTLGGAPLSAEISATSGSQNLPFLLKTRVFGLLAIWGMQNSL